MAGTTRPRRHRVGDVDATSIDRRRAARRRRPRARAAGPGHARCLLDCTLGMLQDTSYRDLKVVDIAREAGTSPATFYQYFPDVESAILALAEEMADRTATSVADLVARPARGRARPGYAHRRGHRRRATSTSGRQRPADAGARPDQPRGRRSASARLRVRLLNEFTIALSEVIAESSRRPGARPTSTRWPSPACWCRCWRTWPPTATASSSRASAPPTSGHRWPASSTDRHRPEAPEAQAEDGDVWGMTDDRSSVGSFPRGPFVERCMTVTENAPRSPLPTLPRCCPTAPTTSSSSSTRAARSPGRRRCGSAGSSSCRASASAGASSR